MVVYQVYKNEQMNDEDGWMHWVDRCPLGINLYSSRDAAHQRIKEELALEIAVIAERMERNPDSSDVYTRIIEGLKINTYTYGIDVKRSEALPRFDIQELVVI